MLSRTLTPLALLCLMVPGTAVASAGLNPPTTLRADPSIAPILLDGHLEEAWFEGARFGNFAEFMPHHLVTADVRTEGYIVHDDDGLFVAFVCHDPQIDRLRASLTDRDQIFDDDFVGIVLDTYRDRKRAYEFFSNAHGIQGDMLWYSNRVEEDDEDAIWQSQGGEDGGFDAVWESAAQIYEDRWVVEMKIPFSSLRFPDREDQDWGLHLVRVYPREDRHQLSWMPISQDDNSFMGQAGTLALSLSDVTGGRSFELIPYVSGSRTDMLVDDGAGRGEWRNDDDGTLPATERIGFTARYGLSSTSSIDVAYKPDFSQIESDAGRIDVNQPFAFFFEERRPFFMEGSDVFQVDTPASGMILDVANLIYTRSINDPILATRLTGKSQGRTYGFISAYDDNSPLILPLADGTVVRRTAVNSWSNIFRGQMQVAEESHVGLAVTHRRFDGGGWNGAGLVETSLRLSDNYTWSALAALTRTDEPDDAELSAILPDRAFEVGGDSITVAFDGQDFGGHVLKTSLVRQSRTWNFNLSYQDYSPGFRADNSAIFSNDGRILHTQQTYNVHFDDHRLLNFVRPGMYLWRKTDYEGDVKDIGVRPSVLFAFQHQTFLNVSGFLFNQEKFRDVEFDDARAVWAYLGSNAFERVSGGIFFNRGEVINRFGVVGSQHDPFELVPSFEWNANLTLKPTERLTAGLRYNDSELRTDAGDELIVRQRIFRHSLQYQFTRELFVRFVGELDRTRRAEAVDGYDESTFYSFEPMLSYRLNAFSVFYLGGDFGLTEDPYINRDGLARTDQTLFLKFQYLMQAN